METELQQAERIARNVMTNQFAFVADVVAVCRVFLAQQARLAEVERERDEWRTAWDGVNTHRNQLREALAAAERKATEAAREQQKAWVAGVRWMCEKFAEAPEVVRAAFTPDKGDVVFYCGERIENIAATLYPAPTEREAEQPSVFRTPAAFSSSIFVTEACADCEALNGNQWSVAGRVYCPKHSITLRPTPPQAAPEPLVIPVKWRNVADGTEQNASTYVRLTPADCRRIVEMGRQHKENAE